MSNFSDIDHSDDEMMDYAQSIFDKIFLNRFTLVESKGQEDSRGPYLTIKDYTECISCLPQLDEEQREHLLQMYDVADKQ